MAQWQETTCEDGSIKKIDVGIKNCFCWGWLEKKDYNSYFLSDYIRKVNISETVLCSLCNSLLSYKSCGKKDIKNYAKNKKHIGHY